MIAEKILILPPFINFEGYEYTFELFINGTDDLRICYHSQALFELQFSKKESPQYFIFLVENISDDESLIEAIDYIHKELKENNLI